MSFLLILLCIEKNLEAQDIIIKGSGEKIQVRILEVSDDFVKYRHYSHPEEGAFTIPVSEIHMIRYENGRHIIFGSEDERQVQHLQEETGTDANGPLKVDKEKTRRTSRIQLGAIARPVGLSLFTIKDNVLNDVEYQAVTGSRYNAAFGLLFDYWLSAYSQDKWYLESKVLYSMMGGTSDYETYDLDYITLDIGIGARGFMYWNAYLGIGILVNAKYTNKDLASYPKANLYSYCNRATFRSGSEFGFCIGKHIDLGLYADFTVSNPVKPELFNGHNDSWNMCLGISACYRFSVGGNRARQ